MRRAIIDIGTNTVKLLVAEVQAGTVTVLANRDKTTRLGEGVNHTRHLSPAAIDRTLDAVNRYLTEARELGATQIHAIATSAVRDADNRTEFLNACPLPVEVITGDREAELIYRGVTSDPAFAGQELVVMDVGGGSAEFIQAGKRVSLPLGAVRLTEMFRDEFPALCAHIRQALQPVLSAYRQPHQKIVGTGGTIVTLARVIQRKADHAVLPEADLRAAVLKLNALPLTERRQVPNLPPDRADIIVAGGMVYILALEALGAHEINVSTRNLRYGALLL